MNFPKKQIHLVLVFWFQKDEVGEMQVWFESMSLKSPFAVWNIISPQCGEGLGSRWFMLWLSWHTRNMYFSVIINFPLHSCIWSFILLGWKTDWRTETIVEKCVWKYRWKIPIFFFLCKLCKTTIFSFAVCSTKNYSGSALVLSTNIWKSTKYVILVAFPLFS